MGNERTKASNMGAEIWIPDTPPHPITIYVDETYLDQKSGLIQVGLPVPDAGDREFKKAVDVMREQFPRFQHAEFKAGKLKGRNAEPYRKFLKYLINLLGAISDQSDLRGVVTIEAARRFSGDEYELLLREVNKTFAILKIETPVGPEFARQVGWLRRNFDYLCGSPIKNPFRVMVDEKHSNAEESSSVKPTLSPQLGAWVWWEHWKHLTTILNCLLRRARKARWTPQFTEFRFENSEKSLYLQAADLLANLFYNALSFEKGIRTETTRLKNDILRTVYDSPFEAHLLDALDVVMRTDVKGDVHDLLVLRDEKFSGRMTLLPQPVVEEPPMEITIQR